MIRIGKRVICTYSECWTAWQKLSQPGKPIGLTYLCIELSLEINFSLRIYLKNQFVIPLVCVKNLGWSQYTILKHGGSKRAMG